MDQVTSPELVQKNANTIRSLLNTALNLAIYSSDTESVLEILDFSKYNMLTLLIDTADLQLLINCTSFQVINKLVDCASQLEKLKFTQPLFRMTKPSKQTTDKSIVSLTLADVVDFSFEMASKDQMTNETRLRMITSLQLKIDFGHLAASLIRRQ